MRRAGNIFRLSLPSAAFLSVSGLERRESRLRFEKAITMRARKGNQEKRESRLGLGIRQQGFGLRDRREIGAARAQPNNSVGGLGVGCRVEFLV